MIQEVDFKGLSFSPSDHESEDGEMGCMLNLLNEDGALTAITLGGGEKVGEIDANCRIALVHKNGFIGGGYCHWILDCVTDGVHTWKWVNKDGSVPKDEEDQPIDTTFDLGSGFVVNTASCMGNMVIFIGDDDTKYALWRDGKYMLFSMQDFRYSIDLRNGKMVSDSYTADLGDDFYGCFQCAGGGSEDEYGYPSSTITKVTAKKEAVPNIFNAAIAKQNEELSSVVGEMHRNIVIGMCAVRLYDGSILNVGGPFVLAPHTTKPLMTVQRSSTSVTMALSAHQHHIKVTMAAAERLGNIVAGVSVYLTIGDQYLDVERAYPLSLTSDTSTNFEGSFSFVRKSGKKLYEAIDGEVFNLAITIAPDEFDTWKELPRVTGAEEAMTLSDFRRGSFGALYSYIYNKRLHLAGLTQRIGNPFLPIIRTWYPFKQNVKISEFFDNHPDAAIPVDQNNQMTGTPLIVDVAMKVKGDFGGDTSEYCFEGDASFPLNPIISFPHTGAKEADLYVRITGDRVPNGSGVWHRHLSLHQSNSWGMSYYVEADDNGWKLMQLNDYTINSYYDESQMTSALRSEWESVTDAEMSAVVLQARSSTASYNESKSLIKVSEVNNPLIFPVGNSVEVGSGEIMGMASNTEPISEGQFGAYPLHVFTDEGVWTLELSDTGTYRSRQPSSRDVISDASSITPIDKGVLFATKRGIMIIRGNQVECLSDSLRGIPWYLTKIPHGYDILGNRVASDVEYLRMDEMMKDARMLYDYQRERVYIYSEAATYALVLSLRTGLWGAVSRGDLQGGVPWYPETYVLRFNGERNDIVDISAGQMEGKVPVLCCTRPLGLGAREMHKSVMHAVVRGLAHMRGSGEQSRLGCAIWGSNDLFHWQAVNTSDNQYLRGRYGHPWKWWRIAVVGEMEEGETIDGTTFDVKVRLNNRLR